jgi:hypothetical protein
MRFIWLTLLLFIACDSSKKESKAIVESEKKYDLYVPSEMANYMNTIFEIHEQMKTDILEGKSPETFPEEILEIHTAHLSDFRERTPNFEAFSHLFVESVEFIFEETSDVPLKQRYNDAINVCISCHQTECLGPIPRIKKLIIN